MGIVQVNGINLYFGDRKILSDVSFTIGDRERAALAGGNGQGKTTLMKAIAGLIQTDGGSVTKTRDMRISYLPQSDIVLKENTVYQEIEKAFDLYKSNIERQHEIENILQSKADESLVLELNMLQEQLLDGPYYRREELIYSIAKGLGLKRQDMERPCSSFSGGFQMRIALAKVLCESPDFIMLDEPTNYLDIESRIWLLEFLKQSKSSVLIVCHDRDFLDSLVGTVYELFNGHLSRYSGNYTSYEKQRKEEISMLENLRKRQENDIEHTQQFIEKFRYKATKSKQVQSRIKMLEKIEPVVVPGHLKSLSFRFPDPPHSPNDIVVIENLTKQYPTAKIFDNFSLYVGSGQRIAVTGHNGIGKTTLLKIIAGIDSEYSGSVKIGSGVCIGYYAQDTADSLNFNNTVFEEVASYGTESYIRKSLGSFLFSGDDILKKVSVLSGGERSRLSLLKILLNPANLLLLDEPTNHLDINAKDMLKNALANYEGTVIFVSHDADFIRGIATSILYLSDKKPTLYDGNYDYFEFAIKKNLGIEQNTLENQVVKKDAEKVSLSKQDRFLSNKERNLRQKQERECSRILEQIEKLEKDIAEIKTLIDCPENYSDPVKIRELVSNLDDKSKEKNNLETMWLDMSI